MFPSSKNMVKEGLCCVVRSSLMSLLFLSFNIESDFA